MPADVGEYVHRIGRTGRVGNPGRATSFIEPTTDVEIANNLVKVCSRSKATVLSTFIYRF